MAHEADRLRSDGIAGQNAEEQARRRLGNLTRSEEEFYDHRPWVSLDYLWQDLRFSFRQMARNPAFTIVAALTLALGIGANTAIFTVVKTVLLTPLPFAQPDRLVHIAVRSLKTGVPRDWVPWRDAVDWRTQSTSFESMGSYAFALMNLVGTDRAEALYGSAISSDLLPTLGVQPILGRNFTREEDSPGRSQEVILSYKLWTERFGRDPSVIGRHMRLSGVRDEDREVIGVMPPSFNFPMNVPSSVSIPSRQMAFWIPLGLDPSRVSRDGRSAMVVGRLKPGRTLAQAQSDLDAVSAQLASEYPKTNADRGVRLVPFEGHVLGRTRPALLMLLGSTGLLVLITCVNIANLLLARAQNRSREIAVRLALGANRVRLVRQWLTESIALSLVGGALGYGFAFAGTYLLLRLAPDDIPRLAQTHIDTTALLFTIGISFVVGILFGVLPAWRAGQADVADAMKEGGMRSTSGPASSRVRSMLIVAEVALSMALITGAGLLVRSVSGILHLDIGFRPDNIVTAITVLPSARYPSQESAVAFYRKVLDRLRDEPGVISAGAVDGVPLSGNITSEAMRIEGRPLQDLGENRQFAEVFGVSEDYLATMSIGLVEGRSLSRHDAQNTFRAALINEAAARLYWPNTSPLGKRFNFAGVDKDGDWREVVGVVKNTYDLNLDAPPNPAIYVPMEQGPTPPQFLAIRTSASAAAFAPQLRRTVAAIDKDQPVFVVVSMQSLVQNAIGPRTFAMRILAVFGVLSLLLAGIGLYGVVSYSVARRANEIGLRVALGATRIDVLRLVLRQSLSLTMAGLLIGFAAASLLMSSVSSLLYGIKTTDVLTSVGACGLLLVVAMLASYIPARQAIRVDPAVTLRQS